MASSYLSVRSPRETRRRTASLLLAVAAHLLIIWLLLRLSPAITMRDKEQPGLSTFNVSLDKGSKPKAEKREKTVAKKSTAKAAAQPKVERQQPVTEHPPAPTPPVDLHLFGHNSPLAGADIGKIKSTAEERDVADSGAGSGKSSAPVYGPGEGPGGGPVYEVGFLRYPTRAELMPYMPPGGTRAGNWGQVVCRMVAADRVDNCRTAGESPVGSGIARGLRLAAWQFKIRPPRVDGKSLIGVWVKFRLTFTDNEADDDGGKTVVIH